MKTQLEGSGIAPVLYLSKRIFEAVKRTLKYGWLNLRMAFSSKEIHSLTYRLSRENRRYLILLTAQITGQAPKRISAYFKELENNRVLHAYVKNELGRPPLSHKKDRRYDHAIALGMYAIIRANKCKVVVENGIDVGYCSLALCSALAKNEEEGFSGVYFGLDINPEAGQLLKGSPDEQFANILVGDSIEGLKSFDRSIDFYFSDGLRTYEYEKREFETLKSKLSKTGVVVSNKANFSIALSEFAEDMGKRFSYFQEKPANHWYQGNGIGFYYT